MRVLWNLPQYEIDFEGGAARFEPLAALASRAEAAGLDGVVVSDHPFATAPDGTRSGALEAFACVAAISRITSRIEVGTLVLSCAMRSAASTVAAIATLAASAPGRVVAGLGTGWFAPEHRAYGVPLASYMERVERLEAVARALASATAPPRLIVGGAGRRAIGVAARLADEWNVSWDVPPGTFRELCAAADAECERAGRDPLSLRRSVGVTLAVGPDDAALRRAVGRLAARAPFLSGLTLEGLRDRIVAGTPERCAEALGAYRDAGAGAVVVTTLLRDDPDMLDQVASVRNILAGPVTSHP